MKVLLVDDEPLQLLRLEKTVKECVPPDSEILAFSNPLEGMEKGRDSDLAFLDIEMPGVNGIQLAKKLKETNPKINIVFVTAYDRYALEAYRIHASGYVTKPVNKDKVSAELANLRHPVELTGDKLIQVKCFGTFEVFHNGTPLKFQYSKSKELFAYLVDREGAAANINELNAVLWEEDHKSYLRNLIADVKYTLKEAGASDVFIKRHNECFVDVTKIDCDAYRYKENDPDAIRAYRGEYMIQYPWAMFSDE